MRKLRFILNFLVECLDLLLVFENIISLKLLVSSTLSPSSVSLPLSPLQQLLRSHLTHPFLQQTLTVCLLFAYDPPWTLFWPPAQSSAPLYKQFLKARACLHTICSSGVNWVPKNEVLYGHSDFPQHHDGVRADANIQFSLVTPNGRNFFLLTARY